MPNSSLILKLGVFIYRVLLHAYPAPFRREYEQSMVQAFGDMSKDRLRQRGMVGIIALWFRVIPDLVSSVLKESVSVPGGKMTVGAGGFYVVLLLVMVTYTAMAFSSFYSPPSIDAHLDSNAVLEVWAKDFEAQYTEYIRFLNLSRTCFALYLGIWAGAFGLWKDNLWQGLFVLVIGNMITMSALGLLPWVYHPLDRYPASALWVIGGGAPLSVISWILVSLRGRVFKGRKVAKAT